MPEMAGIIPWRKAAWDNMSEYSGGGQVARRDYYWKRIGTDSRPKILLVSAVPSRAVPSALHATDYLVLDREAFERLCRVATEVFGEGSCQ